MNFKAKCLLQTVFSNVPKGELMNYFFQKYITRSLRLSDHHFHRKVKKARNHHINYLAFNQVQNPTGKYYEFGAGWTLLIPLTMAHAGFEVYCIDITKLVIPELINDSLLRFQSNKRDLPFEVPKMAQGDIAQKLAANNLYYTAPKDARETGFESNSFDFMSSSNTMEHIPKKDILPILNECYRILNKGGVLSMNIDYQDHWSYFDKSISIYNFLKYSDRQWKKYNPSLHYQNRMRHADYMELIRQSGFKVVKEVPRIANSWELESLSKVNLSDEFRGYSFDELSIKGSEIVLIKE